MMKYTVLESNPEMKGMVEIIPNVVYASYPEDELAMQIVKPMWSSGGKGFPLVVFIQGSGWQKPNQFWEIPQLSRLARRGFVIASVTHRSAWTAQAPAFLKDVKIAIRFLRAHASDYDVAMPRVGAWGTSSGGNTARLLGLTADDPAFETQDWAEESSAVQAVVDCFGPTDLNKMANVQYDTVSESDKNLFRSLGGGDTMEEIAPTLDLISPIKYVVPGRSLPPFMILHGDADELVLFEDSEAMAHRLDECGYEVEFVRVTNAPHEGSFWSETLDEMIFDFIARKL